MGYADDTFANITQEAWNDWVTRYEPVMDQVLNLTDTHQLMTDQLNRVGGNEQNELNAANTAQGNQMGRYGLSDISDPQDQSDSLNMSLSDASAKNGIRTAEQDRDMKILTGTGSGAAQQVKYHTEGAY